MSRRPLLLAAIALAAALTLSACSGSASPSGTASAPSADGDLGLMSAGTLTVATEGTYRPFSYHDESGDLVGFDVEIAEAVADELGLKVSFQETQWDAIFAGLDAGRFDVIANQVSINPEREEKYLFSEPYTVSPGVIVVNEDDDSITSFADLAGKDHRPVAHEQLVRARSVQRRDRRGRRGLGAGRRPPAAGPRGRHDQRQPDLPRLREERGPDRAQDRRRDR